MDLSVNDMLLLILSIVSAIMLMVLKKKMMATTNGSEIEIIGKLISKSDDGVEFLIHDGVSCIFPNSKFEEFSVGSDLVLSFFNNNLIKVEEDVLDDNL